MTPAESDALKAYWPFWSHVYQDPPPGDWTTWLLMAGRGAGKTKAGAEWVHAEVAAGRAGRIGVIGQTMHDARSVMVEGGSGLLNPTSGERPAFDRSLRRLRWDNGAIGMLFSADEPEQLRGPEFDLVWGDEFGKWREPAAAFDMAKMALRMGARPRMLLTTTPRNKAAVKLLAEDARAVHTRAPTTANAMHLSPSFLEEMQTLYDGSALGRQELQGELVEDVEGALWRRAWIDDGRVTEAPALVKIVVGVDPAMTSGAAANACGIIAAGRDGKGDIYVLADATVQGATPAGWARTVVGVAERFDAGAIAVETNQGGEMVTQLLKEVGGDRLPVKAVRAFAAKRVRAEPVALLYETGRIHHVGSLPALEDELCRFGAPGIDSPDDRVDALVWAVAQLDRKIAAPRVRVG